MRLAPSLLLLVALAGTFTVSEALPRVDHTRGRRDLEQALLFVPDAQQIRAASSGFAEPLADLFWVRTVLVFGERFGVDRDPKWLVWMGRMIEAVNTLDPRWRTAYFYGGAILRVSGDVDGSDKVFAAGHAALPKDPFFPFSLGMNAYLYRQDNVAAAEHIAVAASLPDAPSWYAAAAAGMQQKAGNRAAAMRYLEETIADAKDPAVRADSEWQLARLQHDEVVDQWTDACRAWRDEHGPLTAPEELSRVGFALPENPRGDAWIIGLDGVVRSAGAERDRLRRLRQQEAKFVAP